MVDRFTDPLMTPKEAARHLQIPHTTMYYWLHEQANGSPLVHQVNEAKRGRPSVPFVAVVEAYVLRSLRALGLTKAKIRDTAAAVRREFGTPYGLATRRIATDGIDIFIHYADDQLARAGDGQRPIREVIDDYLKFITWENGDDFPARLRLRQYPDVAPVIIDPQFGWGTPVVESTKVPVHAVVDLWRAGESLDDVAYEYDMTREQVESICRVANAA
ncbi:hypothetical protein GCM10022243_63100 [Saccharothrix violaceirubra]|uniref:Uncharacterized protein (DUF433 family) n=1 Tax=Saccharothrix violaceirubra TaxID=413306 RepID=A0A7W7SYL2_9PSEU|nr:DUF433 domain-containing protein [Saccharothrix violaceirubra]MBB4962742.1 uncharacterized protein (DUF433 family) [Saccharothrix violaceirubra]